MAMKKITGLYIFPADWLSFSLTAQTIPSVSASYLLVMPVN
jgi:hypothetical protein